MPDTGWWRHGLHVKRVDARRREVNQRATARANRRDLIWFALKTLACAVMAGLLFGVIVGEINSIARWIAM